MSRKPILAAIISLVVPGLGQMYAGKSERGAAILISVIIIGNLNAIWLSLYSLTSPASAAFWTYTLPRILHDWFAAFGVIFLIWQFVDAYQLTRLSQARDASTN